MRSNKNWAPPNSWVCSPKGYTTSDPKLWEYSWQLGLATSQSGFLRVVMGLEAHHGVRDMMNGIQSTTLHMVLSFSRTLRVKANMLMDVHSLCIQGVLRSITVARLDLHSVLE